MECSGLVHRSGSLVPSLFAICTTFYVAGRQGRAGSEERVPHTREDVSFPLRKVEVVRGAPDGDRFCYPSHPPICYLKSMVKEHADT